MNTFAASSVIPGAVEGLWTFGSQRQAWADASPDRRLAELSRPLPVAVESGARPESVFSALQHLSVAAVARETAAATALSKDYAVCMLLCPLHFVARLLPHSPHLINPAEHVSLEDRLACCSDSAAAASALWQDYAVWMLLRLLHFVVRLLPHPPHLMNPAEHHKLEDRLAGCSGRAAAASALWKDYAVWMLLRPLHFVVRLLPRPPHLMYPAEHYKLEDRLACYPGSADREGKGRPQRLLVVVRGICTQSTQRLHCRGSVHCQGACCWPPADLCFPFWLVDSQISASQSNITVGSTCHVLPPRCTG